MPHCALRPSLPQHAPKANATAGIERQHSSQEQTAEHSLARQSRAPGYSYFLTLVVLLFPHRDHVDV
jgi:hypothetical protein